jgi:hypothetical protein
MANTNPKIAQLLTCGCCFADIQTISASLSHVGYTAFNCGEDNSDTDTKYLQLKKEGIGTVNACGGFSAKKKNLTQTWAIDPFTGTTCYNGDEGTISYLCGETPNCTATQKTYNCGAITEQEQGAFCTEENFEKTLTESLSVPYTLDDVAGNVDSALSTFNFNNPKGTFGVVKFGTNGNKVLQWSAGGASAEARYQRGVGGVYKQKTRIKILNDSVLTKITELETGEVTEETIEVTKNQIIILDPPSEPGKTYFIPYCSTKFISTNVETSSSGTVTTKTNTNENNCTYFTGPDCKQYDTRTQTVTASSSESSSITNTNSSTTSTTTVINESSSYNENTTESIGKHVQEDEPAACYKRETITSSSATYTNQTSQSGLEGHSSYSSQSNSSSTLQEDGDLLILDTKCSGSVVKEVSFDGSRQSSGSYVSGGGFSASSSQSKTVTTTGSYNPDCSLTQTVSQDGTSSSSGTDTEFPYFSSCQSEISGDENAEWSGTAEVMSGDDFPETIDVDEPCGEYDTSEPTVWTGAGCAFGCGNEECITTTNTTIGSNTVICSYSSSCSTETEAGTSSTEQSSTYTQEFSNTAGEEGEGWLVSSSPNESNCASWYITHNFESRRTATVSVEASFQAPNVGIDSQGNPNPPKNYITYVQTIRRKDNTSNSKCPNIQFIQNVSTYNKTSSGGEVKIPVPPITLDSEKDVSDCLVHVSAITFEV